jgi:hypothetical protein
MREIQDSVSATMVTFSKNFCSRIFGFFDLLEKTPSLQIEWMNEPFIMFLQWDFLDFLCPLFNTVSSAATQIPLCRENIGTVATSTLTVRRFNYG